MHSPSKLIKRFGSGHSNKTHKRTSSAGEKKGHRKSSSLTFSHVRQPSASSITSTGSNDLARAFDIDRRTIIRCCFSKTDQDGSLKETYITHVRVMEDSEYPSSRPPLDSPASQKKPRILMLAVERSGKVRLHKGRENKDGSAQVGRTWDLKELAKAELDTSSATGFSLLLAKPYYWETNTLKEREVFLNTLVDTYIKYTKGALPEVVNFDVSHLKSLQSYPSIQEEPKEAAQSVGEESQGWSTRSSFRGGSSMKTGDLADTNRSDIIQEPPLNDANGSRNGVGESLSKEVAPPFQSPQGEPLPQQVSHTSKSSPDIERWEAREFISAPPPEFAGGNSSPRKSSPRKSSPGKSFPGKSSSESVSPHRMSTPQDHLSSPTITSRSKPELLPELASSDLGFPEHKELEPFPGTADAIPDVEFHSIKSPRKPAEDDDSYGDFTDLYYGESETYVDSQERPVESQLLPETTTPLRSTFFDSPSRPALEQSPSKIDINQYGSLQKIINDAAEDDDEPNETASIFEKQKTESPVETRHHDNHLNIVEDLFDEVNWREIPDVSVIEKTLKAELMRLQYENANIFARTSKDLSGVETAISAAMDQCGKLEPILEVFKVELNSFGDEISHLERQGQGLQIETTNKKLLWNELSDILDTVSMPDSDLSLLSSMRFEQVPDFTQLAVFERKLVDLYTALTTMRGKISKNDQLGSMRAIQERRNQYETCTNAFIHHFKDGVISRFKKVANELNDGIPSEASLLSHFLQEVNQKLALFFGLTGITYFIKEVETVVYNEILTAYEAIFEPFYHNLMLKVLLHVTPCQNSFDFGSCSRQIFASRPHTAQLPKEYDSSILQEPGTLPQVVGVFQSFCKSVMDQRRFLVRFFWLSSADNQGFTSLVATTSPRDRVSQVQEFYVEPDRTILMAVSNSLRRLFKSAPLVFKAIRSSLGDSPMEIPAFLLYMEQMPQEVFDQDFIPRKTGTLKEKLEKLWSNYVENQCKIISSFKICQMVSKGNAVYGVVPPVKVFPEFIRTVETEIHSVGIGESDIQTSVNASLDLLWKHLLRNVMFDQSPDDSSMVLNSALTVYPEREDSGVPDLLRRAALLLNLNWLVERLDSLPSGLVGIKRQLQELFQEEALVYCEAVIRCSSVGRLMESFDGIVGSHTLAYNEDSFKDLVTQFTLQELQESIDFVMKTISTHIRSESLNDESEESLAVAKEIEAVLVLKLKNICENLYKSFGGKINAEAERRFQNDVDINVKRGDIALCFQRVDVS